METASLADDFEALGLTGTNKPNGIQYRLRQSVPASTPDYVPRSRDGLELWISEAVEGGWLAFYRERLGSYPGSLNSRYHAAFYGADGAAAWQLDLDRFLSAPTHLEIQDIRLADGDLYFNEACQSYSREAGGRCSALVRVNPAAETLVWRTRHLVSNDIFIVHGDHVVTGYGFTAEPDSLFLVDRSTGRIAASHALDSAHAYLEVSPDGRLVVVTRGRVYRFGHP